MPVNVAPFNIRDNEPGDDEPRDVVAEMRSGRSGGSSFICAEDMKEWLQGMHKEEKTEAEGNGSKEDDGDC